MRWGLNGGRAVLPRAEPLSRDETRIDRELDLPLAYLLRMLIKPGVSARHRRSCCRTGRGVGEAIHDPQRSSLRRW